MTFAVVSGRVYIHSLLLLLFVTVSAGLRVEQQEELQT